MAARLGEDFLYICHMTPFISIIIPFYGTADPVLLQRCITSIREQGMEEGSYEIIVADDNGKGLGGARNRGIGRATGIYLMFVDADDYLFPNISYCFSYLLKYTPDICSFRMCKVKKEDLQPHSSSWHWEVYASGAEYMSRNNFTGNSCRHFFHRDFINRCGLLFAESCYHEDEDFMVRAYFRAETTLITDYPVYAYIMNPSSITHRISLEMRLRRLSDFYAMLCRVRNLYLSLELTGATNSIGSIAVKRRLSFLTIDYVRLLVRNRSPRLKEQFKEMRRDGFLPLSGPVYTWKYRIARIVINFFV